MKCRGMCLLQLEMLDGIGCGNAKDPHPLQRRRGPILRGRTAGPLG